MIIMLIDSRVNLYCHDSSKILILLTSSITHLLSWWKKSAIRYGVNHKFDYIAFSSSWVMKSLINNSTNSRSFTFFHPKVDQLLDQLFLLAIQTPPPPPYSWEFPSNWKPLSMMRPINWYSLIAIVMTRDDGNSWQQARKKVSMTHILLKFI